MIQPKKSILNAVGYEPTLYLDECLMKLDLNENILGPSPKVIEAIKNISEEEIKFYPALGKLIEKLALINNVENNMIMPTNGADEAISYIFTTFITGDDTVLTVKPSFSMPKIYATSVGCRYKEISYKEKWIFPIDDFIENIDEKVRLILLTTPNSPTGDAISRDNLIRIIESAKNSIILIDETYSSYGKEQFSDLVSKYSNVIICRSFSKDYALAGLRLGYIISNSQNIEYIKRIYSPYSVNNIAAKAGIAALEDKEYFEYVKSQIIESKRILSEGLKSIAKQVYRSEGNFLCVDFGEKAEFIYKKLLNAGIKVKYYKNDPDLEGCFRISMPSVEQSKIILNVLKSRDLIIFDIDGVLVDVQNSYRIAIKKTYEFFAQQDLGFEKIQKAKNSGGLNNDWDLVEYLLKEDGYIIPKNQIIDKFQEFYLGNDDYKGLILNEELLLDKGKIQELSKNYDLAIFTGRPKKEAQFVLKRWNLENFFSVVVTMDDIKEGLHKPDPFGINYIKSIVNPAKTYYLGDTPDDMIAAREAGIKGIGVLPPQDKSSMLKEKLLEEGASKILEETQDIISYMGATIYAEK